jgi:hypothetical protein
MRSVAPVSRACYLAAHHLRGALDEVHGLDRLNDVGCRRRDRNEDQIGAADGEDRRLRRGATGVDHHNVVRVVQLGDEGEGSGVPHEHRHHRNNEGRPSCARLGKFCSS